jgi:hypothetical protein
LLDRITSQVVDEGFFLEVVGFKAYICFFLDVQRDDWFEFFFMFCGCLSYWSSFFWGGNWNNLWASYIRRVWPWISKNRTCCEPLIHNQHSVIHLKAFVPLVIVSHWGKQISWTVIYHFILLK